MKRCPLALYVVLIAGAISTAHAQIKEEVDANHASPAIVDSVFVTDLDFDPGYGGGKKIFDFNASSHNDDIGMRTFYRCEGLSCVGYYYVAGYHFNGATYDALVAKTDLAGNPVANWGTGGKMTIPTGMSEITDVAIDRAAGRLYFAGAQRLFSTTSLEFAVSCLDIATGAACTGFGNAGSGTELVVFDLGGADNDVAQRVLLDSDGFLYVAGHVDSVFGYTVAVAKLNAADGTPVSAFDGDGRATLTFGSVFDMALSPATAPQGKRLYLVGNVATSTTYQGYVIGVDPVSGALIDSLAVNNPDISHNAAVSAVAVLANGDIAMAGSMDTNVAGQPQLLLAKMSTQGSLHLDGGFCGGGICTKQLTGEGINHNWTNTQPSAIAERSNTRDLVVGMQAGTWTYDFVTNTYNLTQKQVVQQYSASGTTLHAGQQMGFPVNTGETAVAYSAGMLVDSASVMLTGSRFWSSGSVDYDITVTRMLANDTIFANQFGGANSD